MVVLEAFVAVFALGFGVWILGTAVDRPDVGLVGAILVIGIGGAAVIGDGVLIQTGVETTDTASGEVINNTYTELDTPDPFSLELVSLFLGSLLSIKSIGDMSNI